MKKEQIPMGKSFSEDIQCELFHSQGSIQWKLFLQLLNLAVHLSNQDSIKGPLHSANKLMKTKLEDVSNKKEKSWEKQTQFDMLSSPTADPRTKVEQEVQWITTVKALQRKQLTATDIFEMADTEMNGEIFPNEFVEHIMQHVTVGNFTTNDAWMAAMAVTDHSTGVITMDSIVERQLLPQTIEVQLVDRRSVPIHELEDLEVASVQRDHQESEESEE